MRWRFTSLCLVVSLAILVYLFVNHSTSWLFRAQISMLSTPPQSLIGTMDGLGVKEAAISSGEARAARNALTVAAGKYPMDPEIQLIYTIRASTSREPMLDKVRPLVSRFPDNAFVLATYMRYACMGQIAVRRPEEALLSADKPSTYALVNNGMLPNTLTDYLRAADTGEKLEP